MQVVHSSSAFGTLVRTCDGGGAPEKKQGGLITAFDLQSERKETCNGHHFKSLFLRVENYKTQTETAAQHNLSIGATRPDAIHLIVLNTEERERDVGVSE